MAVQPNSLPVKLYLLSYLPKRGKFGRASDLEYVLRGAALVDLTLRGCLKDADGSPAAGPTARTGDRVLDELLRDIREATPRSWKGWIRRSGRSTLRAVQDQLASARVVEVEERRALGLFLYRRVSLRQPELMERYRERALAALRGDTPPQLVEQADAALVALAAAGQLTTAVSAKDRRQYSARITALGERSGQGVPALKRVIRQVKASRAAAYSGGG